MGDRGGGRESKKGSLRKSTKNPGCAAGKAKSQKKTEHVVLGASLPCPRPGSGAYVDCGCAILSRQFARDRDRVLSRSRQEGVCVVEHRVGVEGRAGPAGQILGLEHLVPLDHAVDVAAHTQRRDVRHHLMRAARVRGGAARVRA